MKKALFLLVLALFSVSFMLSANAFTGTGGTIDLNFGHESDIGGSGSGGTYDSNFVSGDMPAGTWAGGSLSARVGVFFFENPVVAITSPAGGYSTSETSIALVYSGSDADNAIAKYWVKLDSGNWIDNGLNQSYTFSNLGTGSHVLHAIATDASDLNSADANISITVLAPGEQAAHGGNQQILCISTGFICSANDYCPQNTFATVDVTNCCPVQCIPKITVERDTSFLQFSASEGKISSTSANEIYGDPRLEGKRIALPSELIVSRTVDSHVTRDQNRIVSIEINVTVFVKNASRKTFSNVSIIESVPKKLAENVSMISFIDAPKILVMDPVFEWVIPEAPPGYEKSFRYSLSSVSDASILENLKEFFASLPTPTAMISPSEEDSCDSINCNDNNPCTQDYCAEGKCYYSGRDGLYCAPDKICYENACVSKDLLEKKEEPPVVVIQQQSDPMLIMIFAALVAIIIGLLFLLMKKKDEKIEEEERMLVESDLRLKEADERLKEDDMMIRRRNLALENEIVLLEKRNKLEKEELELEKEKESYEKELSRHKTKKEILSLVRNAEKMRGTSVEEVKKEFEKKKRKKTLLHRIHEKLIRTPLQMAAERIERENERKKRRHER